MSAQSSSINSTGLSDRNARQRIDPSLLQAEIDFWRGAIASKHAHLRSGESAERMQQALALAEYRLAALSSNRYTVVA
jgi:hypothetical protein